MWATIGTILGTFLPSLAKYFIELSLGKKISQEEFQDFITADKRSRQYVAQASRNIREEAKRMKAERLKRLKALEDQGPSETTE